MKALFNARATVVALIWADSAGEASRQLTQQLVTRGFEVWESGAYAIAEQDWQNWKEEDEASTTRNDREDGTER